MSTGITDIEWLEETIEKQAATIERLTKDNTPSCAGCNEHPGEKIARLIQDQSATIRQQQAEIERLGRLLEGADEHAKKLEAVVEKMTVWEGEDDKLERSSTYD